METLSDWFQTKGIKLDSRLEIATSPSYGTFIKAKETILEPKVAVAQIPKKSILSRQNCSLSHRIQELPVELSTSLVLSICVLHETLLGSQSRWSTYLKSLPLDTVPVASLWSSAAKEWIVGTDLEKELKRLAIDTSSLQTTYNKIVLPFLSSGNPHYPIPPTSTLFLWSYSIASSRAFQVDSYHQLALVPLADLFNHSDSNQVHFASDNWVCSSCGSFDQCIHDEDSTISSASPEFDSDGIRIKKTGLEDDDNCEIFSDTTILAGEPVCNTYGRLTNAKLLAAYGFSLEANDFDLCTFTFGEVFSVGKRVVPLGEFKSMLKLWSSRNSATRLISNSKEEDQLLCVDADAKISPGLWILIVLSQVDSKRNEEEKYQELVELIELLDQHYREEKDCTNSRIAIIARSFLRLCEARKQRYHRPELDASGIFDLAETIEDRIVVTAMVFAASERMMIEFLKLQWTVYT